jgi:hypothetical protein
MEDHFADYATRSSSEPDVLNAPASEPAQVPSSKPIDSNTNVAFNVSTPIASTM